MWDTIKHTNIRVMFVPKGEKTEKTFEEIMAENFPNLMKSINLHIQEDNKYWQACGEIGTLAQCWWECKMVQLLWKTVWKFLKKLKIELPYDPSIPLLIIYLKELKSQSKRYISTPIFIATLVKIVKLWEQPKCAMTHEWIKKMWYAHTMEYYSRKKLCNMR